MLIKIGDDFIDREATLLDIERADCEASLSEFIRQAWHVVEPAQEYIHGWHVDVLCEHLEAITDGVEVNGKPYNRLLINIPPGTMKSLTVNVFWPAWEWGPCNMPHMRYVCASHNQDNAIRDSNKMRNLITSDWYQKRWPHVKLSNDQNAKQKFENVSTGFRQAAPLTSLTGIRGDRVIIDDPHSVDSANSDQQRQTTNQVFLEAVPTRLNNPIKSAIIVVMQRLHEDDVSGVILDQKLGYDHLCLPMQAELWRKQHPTMLGFVDPRTEEGELLFPVRFPVDVVAREIRTMGPYAAAGQYQQTPSPRGGGVIKGDSWEPWPDEEFPPFDFILASLDTAYTTKQENDFSALTIWGVFVGGNTTRATRVVDRYGKPRETDTQDEIDGMPKVMLMSAWQERLELHQLVEKVATTCRRLKVDKLLIEDKAAGHSVAQELRRLYSHEDYAVQLVNPGAQDKLARLHSIQHLFAEGMIYAPDRSWADMVIKQSEQFPRAKHDDLVDTVSMALRHMRDLGLLTRSNERMAEIETQMRHTGKPPPPLYPV